MLAAVLGWAISINSCSGRLGILATLDARDEGQKSAISGHFFATHFPWLTASNLHLPLAVQF
jgi:hypothetical protein